MISKIWIRLVRYLQDTFQVRRLKAFLIILAFLAGGEGIRYLFNLPVAGNILGMLLLFLFLRLKWINLKDIKPASDKLLEFLVLFFIPYGVGLMVYFDLVKTYWLPLSVAVIASTLLTMYLTAVVIEKFGK